MSSMPMVGKSKPRRVTGPDWANTIDGVVAATACVGEGLVVCLETVSRACRAFIESARRARAGWATRHVRQVGVLDYDALDAMAKCHAPPRITQPGDPKRNLTRNGIK